MDTGTVHPPIQWGQIRHCPLASNQQHQEFPSSLPSKYCCGTMFNSFDVRMGTEVSNMTRLLADGYCDASSKPFILRVYDQSNSMFSLAKYNRLSGKLKSESGPWNQHNRKLAPLTVYRQTLNRYYSAKRALRSQSRHILITFYKS